MLELIALLIWVASEIKPNSMDEEIECEEEEEEEPDGITTTGSTDWRRFIYGASW